MERNFGRIGSPTLRANVWPSLISFWRKPSARWPKTSWKKTAVARPVRSAGPAYGSTSGAATSASSSLRRTCPSASTALSSGASDGIGPVKIVIAVDVHAVRRFSLNEQFQPVVDLAKLQARAFARDLILIVARRAERHDGIQNLRRRAKRARVQANFFFPGFAVGMNGNFRAVESVRLFARKIRSVLLGRLDLHFLARIDLDQAFRGGAELLVGLLPHRAAQHVGSVIDRHRGAKTALAGRGIADLVRVVEIVASHAHLRFEPPRMAVLARKQRPVRAHHFGAVRRSQDVTDEVGRRSGLGKNRHLAVQFLAHRRDQQATAPPGPAVAPGAQARAGERAYSPPRHSSKAKTRVVRNRRFSQNCSIPPRQDSKVKVTSVCL